MIEAHGWHFPDGESHLPEWIAREGYKTPMNGRPAYQGKKQRALLDRCRSFRTAVDVGAHVGLWTYNLAPLFGCVRAFEPVKEHRDCFAFNVSADNVILYPLALGALEGRAKMHTNPTSSGDTFVEPVIAGEVQNAVRMVTLDSFDFEDIDAMKVDVEGYEEQVLRGAEQTLRRCKPVLCVEQKRRFPEKWGMQPRGAIAYLESLGYRVAEEISGDYIMTPTGA